VPHRRSPAAEGRLVAACLAEGGVLYRDVACPCGPLPALPRSALAWSVGISARSFVVLQALLNAAFLRLLAHGLGRHVPSRAAAVIALLGVLPLSMAPRATAGGTASNTSIGLERLVLVVLLLPWTPPEERTALSGRKRNHVSCVADPVGRLPAHSLMPCGC